jgi:D-threo-aldose 1-dehydrogenase
VSTVPLTQRQEATSRYTPRGPLGFGGASLGNMYAGIDDATARATLDAAWESGARHFDTAPVYGRGLGELRFGQALRQYPREEYEITTKVGRIIRAEFAPGGSAVDTQGPGGHETSLFVDSLPFRVDVDYGYDAAMRSVEDSMQRLGLGRLDIVYVHDLGSDHLGDAWEGHFDLAENGCFRALRELRDQGAIGAWGLGNNVLEPPVRALRRADPDVIQIAGRYSLLDQSALDELFPLCAERGVRVVLGGSYNSGLLAGGPFYDYRQPPADKVAARDRIVAVCERHGVDVRAAALQFGAAHPVVSTVVPGTKHPGMARQNAELLSAPVPAELWDDLRAEGLLRPDAPTPA